MRTRARTATVALALLAGLGATATGASADVRILSPDDGGLTTSRVVTAKVKTNARATGFQAYLRGRSFDEISVRFRSGPRGIRTARLRIGSDLVRGRNYLSVKTTLPGGRTETAVAAFTVGRKRAGLLELSGVRNGVMRAPIGVHAVARGADTLHARLNGRSVARLFDERRPGRWRAALAAQDGLRFGHNRLIVTAFDAEGGAYQRVQRTFRIRRNGPLVGAGSDRTTRSGARLRLNGRSTKASQRGAALRLRWQIVGRPRGSKARLSRASSARPLLRGDVPGRYLVELRASERDRRGARAAGAATSDTVGVAVQPNMLPKGVPVTTLTSTGSPAIQVGRSVYPNGGAVQMLILDRTTLAPATTSPNRSYPGTDQGMSQLRSDATGLSDEQLAILSGSGSPAGLSSNGTNILAGVLTSFGATFAPGTGSAADLNAGQWSMVGIQGLPEGTADQFIGLQRDPSVPAGSMTGFFQIDNTGKFTLNWPAVFQTFDTQAPGTTASQNVINIGSQNYTSAALPVAPSGLEGGFHVLWLDAGSLALKGQYTVANMWRGAGSCPASAAYVCIDEFTSRTLPSIENAPGTALIVVASLGAPASQGGEGVLSPGNQGWANLAQGLNGFGASPPVILGLQGNGDYSFLGIEGSLQNDGPGSGTELGQANAGAATARLAGLFERNRQGAFEASANGSPDPNTDPSVAVTPYQPSLVKVLAQPDQPFAPFDSVAEQAAEEYINNQLGFGPLDPTYGIRALYWQATNVSFSEAEVNEIPACKTTPCSRAFRTVRSTLASEFGDVSAVRGYFGGKVGSSLYGVLETAFLTGGVTFTGVSSDITSLYDPPAQPPEGPDALSIAENVLTIASGASGVIPEVGDYPAAAFTITEGVMGLVADLTSTGGGAPALDTATFQADVYGWAGTLTERFTDTLEGIEATADLLVSDAGRLSAAAALVPNPNGAQGGWALDTTSDDLLIAQVQENMAQYMWSTMLPVAVDVAVCDKYPDNPGQGFPSVVPEGVILQDWVQSAPPPNPYNYVGETYIFPVIVTQKQAGRFLSAPTLQTLFSQPTPGQPGNLGMNPLYFLAGAWLDGDMNPTTPGFVWLPNVNPSLQQVFYGCSGQ